MKRMRWVILGVLMGSVACGEAGPADPEVTETVVIADRVVRLEALLSGGFDDFSSPGAAFGYLADDAQGFLLGVALRFNLPLYTADFGVAGDVADSMSGYPVRAPVGPLVDDVQGLPALEALTTDTQGIRTMTPDVVAVLLSGDLSKRLGHRFYVADAGDLTLFREDGPEDVLEGTLRMREVDGLGVGAALVPEGEVIEIERFSFSWSTSDQP